MTIHTRVSITDVQLGDWVLVPGTQNNFFKVTDITASLRDGICLSGISPQGKALDYRASDYFSVRVVTEQVNA